jgi:hypothetical protein
LAEVALVLLDFNKNRETRVLIRMILLRLPRNVRELELQLESSRSSPHTTVHADVDSIAWFSTRDRLHVPTASVRLSASCQHARSGQRRDLTSSKSIQTVSTRLAYTFSLPIVCLELFIQEAFLADCKVVYVIHGYIWTVVAIRLALPFFRRRKAHDTP